MTIPIKRRRFLREAAVAATAVGGGLLFTEKAHAAQQALAKPGGDSRPNIVFILADDWGWGDLGCYGHRQLRTPCLDKMASEGALFTQFYVPASACAPSRAGFMTGQFPGRLGIPYLFGNTPADRDHYGSPEFLDPALATVTQLLHNAGYATGHFGKWHLGGTRRSPSPSAYGIDEAIAFVSNDPTALDKLGKTSRPQAYARIVDEGIRFMEAHRDKPFYLNLWLLDTHDKLIPTEEQMTAYPNLPPGSSRRTYYSAATDSDKQIGRLLDKLTEMGLADNTLVVFSSDNGPEETSLYDPAVGSAGPFRGRKRSLYEGGIRTPFIARWPGKIPAGRVDDQTILGGVDWLPTVCKVAGVALSSRTALDGQDMLAALRGTPVSRSKPLFWEWRFNIIGPAINKSLMLAMRENRWKLLMNPDKTRIELYDLQADPSEVDNVADRNPAVVAQMMPRLLAWKAAVPVGPTEPGAGAASYPWPGKATSRPASGTPAAKED
jgi:N-acetylgalactosamine-6-sulfatase